MADREMCWRARCFYGLQRTSAGCQTDVTCCVCSEAETHQDWLSEQVVGTRMLLFVRSGSVLGTVGSKQITLYERGRRHRGMGVGDGVSNLLVSDTIRPVREREGVSPAGLCADDRSNVPR